MTRKKSSFDAAPFRVAILSRDLAWQCGNAAGAVAMFDELASVGHGVELAAWDGRRWQPMFAREARP